jgi:hypothetical protein
MRFEHSSCAQTGVAFTKIARAPTMKRFGMGYPRAMEELLMIPGRAADVRGRSLAKAVGKCASGIDAHMDVTDRLRRRHPLEQTCREF